MAENSRPPSVPDSDYQPTQLAKARFGSTHLLVSEGPSAGQKFAIPPGVSVIGRVSTADIRLQHASISRQHAQLVRKGDKYFIKDLGSQNGTFVNQIRLNGELEVRIGDEIALGNAILRVLGEGAHSDYAPSTLPEAPASAIESGRISKPPTRDKQTPSANSSGVLSAASRPARETSLMKAAIIAGILGFVVAAGVLVLFLRASSSNSNQPIGGEIAGVAPPSPEIELEEDPVVRPMFASEEENQKVKRALVEAMREPEVESDVPPPTDQGISTSKSVMVNRSSDRAQVIEKFEEGKLVSALDLARATSLPDVYEALTKFQVAYEDARAAQRTSQHSLAIRHYETALQYDRELANGNSFFASEIKSELADLMVLVAQKQKDKKDLAGAKKSLSTALKYKPSHSEAKQLLASLKPAPAPVPKKKSRPKRKVTSKKKNAIDEAFDEDEEFDDEPTPRKSKGSRSDIDDAFDE